MAKQRLFPELPEDDARTPETRFSDLGSKVFSVPKSTIDERDKEWQRLKRAAPPKPS